jgi:hypothetical protein
MTLAQGLAAVDDVLTESARQRGVALTSDRQRLTLITDPEVQATLRALVARAGASDAA